MECALLRIDMPDGILSMHDQLRDLAWALNREAGPIDKRARVRGDDAAALLQEAMKKVCCPATKADLSC